LPIGGTFGRRATGFALVTPMARIFPAEICASAVDTDTMLKSPSPDTSPTIAGAPPL
jgi:hypothetical protein